MKVERGRWVTLHVELRDERGQAIEGTGDEPVRYRHGDGEILAGLERALDGACAGDELTVELEPDEAFGPIEPEGLFSVPLTEFGEVQGLEKGTWITIGVSPESPDEPCEEGEIEARVIEVSEEEVVLDANHPLAGCRVTAYARILKVEAGGAS